MLLFVADYHALTTNYEHSETIDQYSFETVVDWLAAGVNPGAATVFVQNRVPEHAELHLMLSMIAPRRGWSVCRLIRISNRNSMTEIWRPMVSWVTLAAGCGHIDLSGGSCACGSRSSGPRRVNPEIARRFNHVYGREPGFEELAEAAVKKMGKKAARLYVDLRREYQERGDAEALERARALLAEQQNLSIGDTERLFGYLEGSGRIILPEPQSMLAEQSKMPGLDGEKMSKSYNNIIGLREIPRLWKVRYAPCRQTQPECGVTIRVTQTFAQCLRYEVYSGDDVRQWVTEGVKPLGSAVLIARNP